MAGWVKKNFAYCMRRLREKGVGVLETGLHIALHRHLFDDHEQCDGVWCAKKRGGAGSLYRPCVKETKEKARAADMPSPPADQGHAGGGLAA